MPVMPSPFDTRLADTIALQRRRGNFDEEQIRRDFGQVVGGLKSAIERARGEDTAGAYGSLDLLIDRTRNDLREAIHGLTHERMWGIILRLRAGEQISDEDWGLIRLWLVGDADAYVFEEANLMEWVNELARLEGEVARLEGAEPEPETLNALCALLTDAHGVVLDIGRYLLMRERIQRFQTFTAAALTEEDRQGLANVLVQSLHSTVS